MSFLDDLIGTGATVAGIESQKNALDTLGTGAVTGAATIGQNAINQSAFKPYAVTTSLGSTQTDAQGGFTSTLSPEQLAMQQQIMQATGNMAGSLNQPFDPAYGQFAQQALQGANTGIGNVYNQDPAMQAQRAQMQGMFGTAAQNFSGFDTAGRQQEIYNQMRSMQQPEEERQRLALEERLFAQGRGGVQTAQYGGTPEQLAQAKAQAEGQNQAGLMAMQQAGSEQDRLYNQMQGFSGQDVGLAGAQQQLQQGNLGLAGGMMQAGQQARMNPQQLYQMQLQNLMGGQQAGYAGENQMLNNFQAGSNSASLADMARRQGAQYSSEAGMSGLQAQLQAGLKSADLTGQYYGAAANLAGSKNEQQQGMLQQVLGGTDFGTSLPDWLKNLAGIPL